MSFAAEEGRELGLKLGDAITVNILGRDITATIASFREVRFESMGISFVMIVDPAALAGAPHTHIATVDATPEAEAPLVRAVAEAWPNVTAIGVRDGIARVAAMLDGIAAATRWAALATLSTGLMVLVGAAAAGERRRVYEAAVLKTLGASRGRILASFALAPALTGAAAGLVAIVAGGVAGWAVTVFVLEGDFRFRRAARSPSSPAARWRACSPASASRCARWRPARRRCCARGNSGRREKGVDWRPGRVPAKGGSSMTAMHAGGASRPVVFSSAASAEEVWTTTGLDAPESALSTRPRHPLRSNIAGEPAGKDGNGYLSILAPDGTSAEGVGDRPRMRRRGWC